MREATNMGEVRMLPGAERPEAALSWLNEMLVDGKTRGIIVTVLSADEVEDTRIFGHARRYELAFVGALLSNHAVNGDSE